MSKKVYIDPGHGGSDSGAIGVNNSYEKDITLSVAKKVEVLLKNQGLDIRLSRDNDKTLSLSQRTTDANNWGADCFLSIHCNAYNGNAKGIETYSYNESTNDLAVSIQKYVLDTKAYTKNRGVKTAGFYVIKYTNMRAALIEMAFIDNDEDYKILTQDQDKLAEGISRGICSYLGIEYIPTGNETNNTIPPIENTDVFYRVVCGSFNTKVYAEERVEDLKDKGYDDVFIDIYKKE